MDQVLQQFADVVDDGQAHIEAGTLLLKQARRQTVRRKWPAHAPDRRVFVPALSLSTPLDTLATYAKQRSGELAACSVAGGQWLDSAIYADETPNSDDLYLPRRLKPSIGNVNVDDYVAFLKCYRAIVESRSSALTKLAALSKLGNTKRFRAYLFRHVECEPDFPLGRFCLSLKFLPGAGPKIRSNLEHYNVRHAADVAANDQYSLAAAMCGQTANAGHMIREAKLLMRRAMIPVSGERLGPRSDA